MGGWNVGIKWTTGKEVSVGLRFLMGFVLTNSRKIVLTRGVKNMTCPFSHFDGRYIRLLTFR